MRNTDKWNLKGNDKNEVERRRGEGGGVMVEKKGGGGVSTHAERRWSALVMLSVAGEAAATPGNNC